MIRKRTFYGQKVADVFHQERFFPAGSYLWTVPEGCISVDVFLVGGGGGCANVTAGAGGYTKTYKQDTSGYRDGGPVSVSPGQSISVVVGAGGTSREGEAVSGDTGGYSQFMSSYYRANGGGGGYYDFDGWYIGQSGSGGSGGCGWPNGTPGSDGSSGTGGSYNKSGTGQGHTTRDFGESSGNRNAGGGGCSRSGGAGGASDYAQGSGSNAVGDYGGRNITSYGGGGYGGGAAGAAAAISYGNGGDGTVLIRYYAYK